MALKLSSAVRAPAPPAETRARSGGRSKLANLALDQQHRRVAGSLTPRRISRILQRADIGYMAELCDLGDELAQKDSHLQALRFKREMSVENLPWQVLPMESSNKAVKIAAWVERMLREFGTHPGFGPETRDFRALIGHCAAGDFYGYSVAEILSIKKKGKIQPAACIPHQPRRFIFSQTDGSLRFWDEDDPSSPYPGIDITDRFPNRFLVYRARVNNSVACREGLIRNSVWMSAYRVWATADWMKCCELSGKPWRVGYFDETKVQHEDLAALEEVIEQLTTTGVALLPQSCKLVIEWVKNNAGASEGIQKSIIQHYAGELSKLHLGETLSTEIGSKGSFAASKTHNEVRKEVRERVAIVIATIIRRYLIAPFVRMNFGNDAPVPVLVFRTDDALDQKALAESLKLIVDAGLPVPHAYVYDVMGIPIPAAGEPVLYGASEAMRAGKAPEGDADPSATPSPSGSAEPPGSPDDDPTDEVEDDEPPPAPDPAEEDEATPDDAERSPEPAVVEFRRRTALARSRWWRS
ncbi:MAG: phage portal protein family protein [Kofleriaceae bacterium]